MTEVFYKKVGRKYVAISEYDHSVMDSFPYGAHLVLVRKGVTSRKYNVDPAFAPLIAAGAYARDVLADKIVKAGELRPAKTLSDEQRLLWDQLAASLSDDEKFYVTYGSAYDMSESVINALVEESNKLLENPSVKQAYEHFMLMAKLAIDHNQNKDKQ